MALETINKTLGITEIPKKKEKEDFKVYFNKKAHRVALRFDPGFKSGLIEFLYDADEKKLVIIEGKKDSVTARKITKSKSGNFITSYAKLFKIDTIPEKGSLECVKETIGIPKKSSDGIKEVKGYTINLNQKVVVDSVADAADDIANVPGEETVVVTDAVSIIDQVEVFGNGVSGESGKTGGQIFQADKPIEEI